MENEVAGHARFVDVELTETSITDPSVLRACRNAGWKVPLKLTDQKGCFVPISHLNQVECLFFLG